jgi:23S rRNA pseudouridine955/2504/2580 synthase
MTNFNLTIGKDDDDRRLDRILRKAFKDFPLSFIHRLIRRKQVLINNVPAKMDARVHEGDVLSIKGNVTLPEKIEEQETVMHSAKKLTKLDVLYEASGLIVVNKPSGLEVHGEESLETLVHEHLKGSLPSSLSFKSGPLHRLDKPTSGIIAFSTSLEGARKFSNALQSRQIQKYYLALVDGIIEKKETWEDMLFRDKETMKTVLSKEKGQNAVMMIHPLMHSLINGTLTYTLALIELVTGRTHQIRSQADIHHHPLAGDKKYGGSFLAGGFFLHAYTLALPEGLAPNLPLLMIAPLPAEKKSMLQSIFGNEIDKMYEKSVHHSVLDGIL